MHETFPDIPILPVSPRQYRDVMGLFATGVTVITAAQGKSPHGMTANAVTSVSLEPTLLLVSIDRRARMHDIVLAAERFAVNILAEDQEDLSNHFAGRHTEQPAPSSLRFKYDYDGAAPRIESCLATIQCVVERVLDGGDHSIVLGRVLAIRADPAVTRPLIFHAGGYRRLAEHDSGHLPAPDPWRHGAARLYFSEWDAPAEPEEQAFSHEHGTP